MELQMGTELVMRLLHQLPAKCIAQALVLLVLLPALIKSAALTPEGIRAEPSARARASRQVQFASLCSIMSESGGSIEQSACPIETHTHTQAKC